MRHAKELLGDGIRKDQDLNHWLAIQPKHIQYLPNGPGFVDHLRFCSGNSQRSQKAHEGNRKQVQRPKDHLHRNEQDQLATGLVRKHLRRLIRN